MVKNTFPVAYAVCSIYMCLLMMRTPQLISRAVTELVPDTKLTVEETMMAISLVLSVCKQ